MGFRYADDMFGLAGCAGVRVLIVEEEPYMADAICDGLRLEAIAAEVAGDGERALGLSVRPKVAVRRSHNRI